MYYDTDLLIIETTEEAPTRLAVIAGKTIISLKDVRIRLATESEANEISESTTEHINRQLLRQRNKEQ